MTRPSRRCRFWTAGALLGLLLAGAWLAGDWEPLTLNEDARRKLPGRFVGLSDGSTGQLEYKGFKRALVSSIAHMPIDEGRRTARAHESRDPAVPGPGMSQ